MDNNDKYKHMRALAWMTQFGLNIITPIILCIIVAAWAKNKFNLGDWVILLAIILGVGSSVMNMISFIKSVNKENRRKPDDKEDKD